MEREYFAQHIKEDLRASAPHSLGATRSTRKKTQSVRLKAQKHSNGCSKHSKHSETSSEVLDACRLGYEELESLSDPVEVGLQQYTARTFHVTLFPRLYKDRQGPP